MLLEFGDQQDLEKMIDMAAANGDQQLLTQLHAVAGPLFTDALCSKVAWVGDLTTLQFLRSLTPPCPLSPMACFLAMEACAYDTAAWLVENGPPGGPELALEAYVNTRMIQWVYDHTTVRLSTSSAGVSGCSAGRFGDLDFITWLLRPQSQAVHQLQDDDWSSIASAAAQFGHAGILKCLAEAGKPIGCSQNVCLNKLARHGRWTAFQSLMSHPKMRAAVHTNNAGPADSDSEEDEEFATLQDSASEAAKQGRLDILQWLAASSGQDVVSWCEVAAAAADNGDRSILAFLQDLQPPPSWELCYDAAIRNGDLATLEWLYTHGLPLDVTSPAIMPISKAPSKVVPWMAAHTPASAGLEGCQGGRLLYLTNKGWLLPSEQVRSSLCIAQACFCAFYGAARWLSKQEGSHTLLGSLSHDLLQEIACWAQIDFCAGCNDQVEAFDYSAKQHGGVDGLMHDLTGEEYIDDHADADPWKSVSGADELAEAYDGLTLADVYMADADLDSSELEIDQCADRLRLASCLRNSDGPDFTSDDDDPEWLPDGQIPP